MHNIGDPELIRKEIQFAERANDLIRDLGTYGATLANAEYNYKAKKSETALRLKAEGMASTLISQVLDGYKGVAELRLKRDIAEAQYEACKESINLLKYQIRIIESQLEREYAAAGRE